MVLYSLITLKEPFFNISNPFKIYQEIQNEIYPILSEETISRFSSSLIGLHRDCIHVDPLIRPSASEIVDVLQSL